MNTSRKQSHCRKNEILWKFTRVTRRRYVLYEPPTHFPFVSLVLDDKFSNSFFSYCWKVFWWARFLSRSLSSSLSPSATGGADSRPVSEKGSPTEEQAGMVGNGNKSSASNGTRGKFAGWLMRSIFSSYHQSDRWSQILRFVLLRSC